MGKVSSLHGGNGVSPTKEVVSSGKRSVELQVPPQSNRRTFLGRPPLVLGEGFILGGG